MADVRSGLDPVDFRFLKEEADPGFSPERNQAVINETIQETTKFFNETLNATTDAMRDRIDIMSSYAMHTINKGHSKSLSDYLGRPQYEALIGEKLLSKVRVASTLNKLGAKTLTKGIFI